MAVLGREIVIYWAHGQWKIMSNTHDFEGETIKESIPTGWIYYTEAIQVDVLLWIPVYRVRNKNIDI